MAAAMGIGPWFSELIGIYSLFGVLALALFLIGLAGVLLKRVRNMS
jgi:hypothetical protein